MTFDMENPGPGLKQVHKCGGASLVNGITTLPYW